MKLENPKELLTDELISELKFMIDNPKYKWYCSDLTSYTTELIRRYEQMQNESIAGMAEWHTR